MALRQVPPPQAGVGRDGRDAVVEDQHELAAVPRPARRGIGVLVNVEDQEAVVLLPLKS